MVKRIFDEGHQVGSHTWSHPNLDHLKSEDRKIEVLKGEQAIFNVIGKRPAFMRAPYVRCGSECQKDMKALGYHIADWQYDSADWMQKQEPVEHTVARLTADIKNHRNGSMFLIQHDTRKSAPKLTRALLEYIDASDWKATTLVECVGGSMADAYQ